ncbi:hypothetical protein J6TS7_65340 [Paenibacillus dendritiformis]|nr:hypothetical protein [Paenibacillus phage Pd_22F]GIO82924.1 hypothetical protein J6TS7_65340 [Paenibacillus dendritiformis]
MNLTRLLRERAAILSIRFRTPIPYWLELPLDELLEWIDIGEEIGGENR